MFVKNLKYKIKYCTLDIYRSKCHVGAINFIHRLPLLCDINNYLIYTKFYDVTKHGYGIFIYIESKMEWKDFLIFIFSSQCKRGGGDRCTDMETSRIEWMVFRTHNIYVRQKYYHNFNFVTFGRKWGKKIKILQNIYVVCNYWLTYDMLCPLEKLIIITFSFIRLFSFFYFFSYQ